MKSTEQAPAANNPEPEAAMCVRVATIVEFHGRPAALLVWVPTISPLQIWLTKPTNHTKFSCHCVNFVGKSPA